MADKKGSVICVDDEPSIVRSLQWLLQKEFDVVTATSGSEALALIRQRDFDVIISDQRMPMMTGVELLREVRLASPNTIRILLTGYSDYQAVLRSVNESEVFRFINKPWNISELPQIVAQAVAIARSQVAETEPSVDESTPILPNGESILLIDDNPVVHESLAQLLGNAVVISHAADLARAVTILNKRPVSVVMSDTKVGGIDATRLICLLKQKYPEIVTVIFTTESDAETITKLINKGQVYRIIPKQARLGYVKQVIHGALLKHRQIKLNPKLAGRYAVQTMTEDAVETLIQDVGQSRINVAADEVDVEKGGVFGRFTSGIRRLLGG
ncbi:MAG: response regulator [Betaproteobacteria bacterium]|nr:response regulator [Betaproteobacteria bacterium]